MKWWFVFVAGLSVLGFVGYRVDVRHHQWMIDNHCLVIAYRSLPSAHKYRCDGAKEFWAND